METNNPSTKEIDQTLNNTANSSVATRVINWFSTDQGQAYLSTRIDEDFELINAGNSSFLNNKAYSNRLLREIKLKIKYKKTIKLLINTAAALCPILFAYGLYMTYNKADIAPIYVSSMQEVYVEKGQSLMVLLHDGSKVHLNADSKLYYPATFNSYQRRVRLEGEGWFEVAASKTHPFIVEVNGGEIEVTGTQFNVKAYPIEHSFYVELEKGIVDVKDSAGHTSVRLKPGEKAEYNHTAHTLNVSNTDLQYAMSGWRKNQISFLNVNMRDVLSELSRVFNIDFKVNDHRIYNYSVTLQADKGNINDVLSELKIVLPIDFEVKGSVVSVKLTNN